MKDIPERTICNGDVVLFTRKNSKRWQARIKRSNGEWIDISTKQLDFEEARAVVEERYRDIKYAQTHGKIDVTRKFSSICKLCKKELVEKAAQTNLELPKNLAQVIDKYIESILGQYMCHNIDTLVLQEYSKERAKIIGHSPTKSTVATHNTALNYLFKKAKEKNYIEFSPKIINDGVSGKRRSHFTEDELSELYRALLDYLGQSKRLHKAKKGRNGIDTISYKSYWI